MKKIGLLLTLLLILSLVAPAQSPQAAQIQYYGYSQLESDIQRSIYQVMVQGIAALEEQIRFHAEGVTDEDVFFVEEMVYCDHPEFFWFDGSVQLQIYDNGDMVLYPTEGYHIDGHPVTAESVVPYIQAMETVAREVLAGMPEGTAYEKARYLHDFVAYRVSYAEALDHQTSYGALIKGVSVCAGYSRAYQYLLQKAGIEAFYVTGYATSNTAEAPQPHGWDLVFLDGKCYYTDVTWDDQNTDLFYTYFMLCREDMGVSHTPDRPELLPDGEQHRDMDYYTLHSGPGTGIGRFTGQTTAEEAADWFRQVTDGVYVCQIRDVSQEKRNDADTFLTWLTENGSDLCRTLNLTGNIQLGRTQLGNVCQVTLSGTPGQTQAATEEATAAPTQAPTTVTTQAPMQVPTTVPTQAPMQVPTTIPTQAPTQAATTAPTQASTTEPPAVTTQATTLPVTETSQAPTSEPTVMTTQETTAAAIEESTVSEPWSTADTEALTQPASQELTQSTAQPENQTEQMDDTAQLTQATLPVKSEDPLQDGGQWPVYAVIGGSVLLAMILICAAAGKKKR